MKKIPLTKGKFAIVDDDDFVKFGGLKWHTNDGYAARAITVDGKRVVLLMHREIMNTPVGFETDHRNSEILDNRKANLRVCTNSQNQGNRRKGSRKYSSIFKGVVWRKSHKCWTAQIRLNYKQRHLGYFNSETDAAHVYNAAASEAFGEFAKLNPV